MQCWLVPVHDDLTLLISPHPRYRHLALTEWLTDPDFSIFTACFAMTTYSLRKMIYKTVLHLLRNCVKLVNRKHSIRISGCRPSF